MPKKRAGKEGNGRVQQCTTACKTYIAHQLDLLHQNKVAVFDSKTEFDVLQKRFPIHAVQLILVAQDREFVIVILLVCCQDLIDTLGVEWFANQFRCACIFCCCYADIFWGIIAQTRPAAG